MKIPRSERRVTPSEADFQLRRSSDHSSALCKAFHKAEETPVAFEYNGISHAVMLATPGDLEDLAVGFSLSEGIVAHRQHIVDIRCSESEIGITLQLEIASEDFVRLKAHRRSLVGRTGCGFCGAESLDQVMRDPEPLPLTVPFPLSALYAGMRRLPALQVIQQATGATHAACRVNHDGAISHVREDIGRHNALDKTLGALARDGFTAGDGALIITSRASFEMVQKAAALGVRTLAAVSAPTARAVRLAESLNVTLIGFLRQETCVIYTGSETMSECSA